MRHLDLFSGIGGFALAASWVWGADHEIVAFCEIDKYCRRVLGKHWPGVPIIEDIRNVTGSEFEAIDLLTGGFPCQDLSCAGKMEGIEGERSGLWSELHRIIGEIRPKYALIENVTNLLRGGQESGLAEFSATWPRSGMMRNGTVYQLEPLVSPMREIASGLLPTPTASDYIRIRFSREQTLKSDFGSNVNSVNYWTHQNLGCPQNAAITEKLMGYPKQWTNADLERSETP